jgi:hypothetical protein
MFEITLFGVIFMDKNAKNKIKASSEKDLSPQWQYSRT